MHPPTPSWDISSSYFLLPLSSQGMYWPWVDLGSQLRRQDCRDNTRQETVLLHQVPVTVRSRFTSGNSITQHFFMSVFAHLWRVERGHRGGDDSASQQQVFSWSHPLYPLSILHGRLWGLADCGLSFLYSLFLFFMYFFDRKESLKHSLTYLPLQWFLWWHPW